MLLYDSAFVDGSNLAHRCFVDCEKDEKTFLTSLETANKYIVSLRNRFLHQTSDMYFLYDNALSGLRRRKELDPNYKGHREKMPGVFFEFHDRLRQDFKGFRLQGYEADDILFLVLKRKAKGKSLLISSDVDWSAYVTESIDWYDMRRVYDLVMFHHEFRFPPSAIWLWKTVTGDVSDNIPSGCLRFPMKIFREIADTCRTPDDLFADTRVPSHWREALEESRERIELNWQLVSPKIPLEQEIFQLFA